MSTPRFWYGEYVQATDCPTYELIYLWQSQPVNRIHELGFMSSEGIEWWYRLQERVTSRAGRPRVSLPVFLYLELQRVSK